MKPLARQTFALAEGRQLEELAGLLEAEGASILRCPMFSILDATDVDAVLAWIDDLVAKRMHRLVLMTGEAVRRLTGIAERANRREEFVQALARTWILTRGPKPGQALKELGLKPSKVAAAPTTEGVISSLAQEELAGQVVGYTLYGSDNPALDTYLRSVGATPRPVLSYVYAPASDDDRVADLIDRLAAGAVDGIVFTSSPQVDRLVEVASNRHLEETLSKGLALAWVAAVGPTVSDRLREAGFAVDICPEQGWVMKNLVQKIVRTVNT